MSILIKNGSVFFEGKFVKTSILIDGAIIKDINPALSRADKTIDAAGNYVIPGLIDCHVHMREPGGEYKEDFLTGSMAAAKGGVTTILAMPNTNPPISTAAALEKERELAKKSIVNYGLYFAGTDESVSNIKNAKNIAGIKIYMDVTTGNLKVSDDALLKKLFSSFRVVACHSEGDNVKKAISMIKDTCNTLYLCHVSKAAEIDEIKKNKSSGNIFCEVTPHHLFLNKDNVKTLNGFGIMKPALQNKSDQEELWKAIEEGVVDTIGTDHAPHTIEEKKSANPPSGVPGLETMLPLMLDAVNKKRITFEKLIQLCCINPAKIFRIMNKGEIKKGYDADITIVDMNLTAKVDESELLTKCRWSPFRDWGLKGWPVLTIVKGNIVYDNMSAKGKIFEEIKGKEILFNQE